MLQSKYNNIIDHILKQYLEKENSCECKTGIEIDKLSQPLYDSILKKLPEDEAITFDLTISEISAMNMIYFYRAGFHRALDMILHLIAGGSVNE